MKNFLKILFSIILIVIILGTIFYMVDTTRVHNDEEPIFVFNHKIVDGINYSAKVDVGLGYKIIRYDIENQENIIKVGTIFMEEGIELLDNVEDIESDSEIVSGESGEEIVKITTFGEKYKESVSIEGFDEEVYVQKINSKLGYTMTYYYELFEYAGFDDHDRYLWYLSSSSGETKSSMTIYDVSNEEAYKEFFDKISEDGMFEEISGDISESIENFYYRTFEEDSINKVNYIYIINLNDLRLMVDLYYPEEAAEGVGIYMHKMAKSIIRNIEN